MPSSGHTEWEGLVTVPLSGFWTITFYVAVFTILLAITEKVTNLFKRRDKKDEKNEIRKKNFKKLSDFWLSRVKSLQNCVKIHKPEAWLAVWASGLAGLASRLAGWASGLAVCASGLTGWASVLAGWASGLDSPEGGRMDKQMDAKSPYVVPDSWRKLKRGMLQ